MSRPSNWGDLDRLAQLAETIAGAWGARARASTTVGRERAILRLFGVTGLDRAGRPLAGQVVDRYIGSSPERLASGIALPFAMALLEYDVGPQQLALDVASGAVDLALEAELLDRPDRRAMAEAEATRLAEAAVARIDANRVARHELVDVLGDAARPWVGTTVLAPAIDDAIDEATYHAREGIDVLRVEVPVGRELAGRLHDAGLEVPIWEARSVVAAPNPVIDTSERDQAPTGSQRALAWLRRALDEAAAARRSYVRLATSAPALAAPEQAVVAAFERIDLVEADAMAEIVAGHIDPDRALADHAFAHRLLRRAGSLLVLGAGPLVVGPDLAAGQPSDPATRAGRALGLQLVGAAIARGDGLAPGQVVVGALPEWLTDERAPAARAAAEIAVRRALLPDHPLAFEEPPTVPERGATWPYILAAVLPAAQTAFISRRPVERSMRAAVVSTRSAAMVAAELGGPGGRTELHGDALTHAQATVGAAIATLERLGDAGWRAVLGQPSEAMAYRMGRDAVTERSDPFDPLAGALGEAG